MSLGASTPLPELHVNAPQSVYVPHQIPTAWATGASSVAVVNAALGFVHGGDPVCQEVLFNNLLGGNFPSRKCLITFRDHQFL